jgi:hypothetical protein
MRRAVACIAHLVIESAVGADASVLLQIEREQFAEQLGVFEWTARRSATVPFGSESVRHLVLRRASMSPRRWLLSKPTVDLPGQRSRQSH